MCRKSCNQRIMEKLTNCLQKEAEIIEAFIRTNSSKEIDYRSDLFTLVTIESYSNKEVEDKAPKKAGIYIFVVEEQIDFNKDTFNSVSYGAKSNKNYDNLKTVQKGCIFYLGKNEKSLSQRLKEHLENDGKGKTYSLKLSTSEREYIIDKLKVHLFVLNDDYKDFAKIILSYIESELHDLLKPIVGSKRA